MDKVIFLEYRGCSCQKSQCIKKYCECFAQGLKCTNRCGCIKCCNWMDTSVKDTKDKVKDNWQV